VIDNSNLAPYLKKCVQMRYALTRFFANGEFQHPLSLSVPDYTTDRADGTTMTTKAVEHGIWRQDLEDEMAIVFSNPTPNGESTSVDITLADYGFSGTVNVQRVESDGTISNRFEASTSISRNITVGAEAVWSWIISNDESFTPSAGALPISNGSLTR